MILHAWRRWLCWLDSHDGRLYRRQRGGNETDADVACLLPDPPGAAIVTIGDLRALVYQITEGTTMKAERNGHPLLNKVVEIDWVGEMLPTGSTFRVVDYVDGLFLLQELDLSGRDHDRPFWTPRDRLETIQEIEKQR